MGTNETRSGRKILLHLPLALTWFRLVSGIAFVPLVWCGASPYLFATLLVMGLLSDIADGMVARRLGVDTLALRRFDTFADLIFYLGAAVAAFLLSPGLFSQWLPWLSGYLALFLLRNAVDFFRYRASPSYHMWSGRIWSILLFACLVAAFFKTETHLLFIFAFAIYSLNAAEGIVASLILPRPGKDIPTLWHALAIRRRDT